MANKRVKKATTKKKAPQSEPLLAVILFTVGVFLSCLAIIEGSSGWAMLRGVLLGLSGLCAYIVGPLLIWVAVMVAFEKFGGFGRVKQVLAIVWLLLLSATATLFFANGITEDTGLFTFVGELYSSGKALDSGGVLSLPIAYPLAFLGDWGSRITASILLFAVTMLLTGTTVRGLVKTAQKPVKAISEGYLEGMRTISETTRRKKTIDIPLDDEPTPAKKETKPTDTAKSSKQRFMEAISEESPSGGETVTEAEAVKSDKTTAEQPETTAQKAPAQRRTRSGAQSKQESISAEENKENIENIIKRIASENIASIKLSSDEVIVGDDAVTAESAITDIVTEGIVPTAEPTAPAPQKIEYVLPPMTLLKEAPPQPTEDEVMMDELKQNAGRLVDTLISFGVSTRIVDICRGPAVTRYELQPAAGVKISKITGLSDDIALNLAAQGVRIEAPIPGKAAVGIEIPNKIVTPVSLREVVDAPSFREAKSPVTVALGRDIAGGIVLADISKMPHLLIAGATGSGKSVCINSIIMSLLLKSTPHEVKLLMIDPKVVELGIYNGLPQLLVPVVTDAKKAAGALAWAVSEMLTRYRTFASLGVRDISGYNKLCEEQETLVPMPYIVIIIDELADLMMAAPSEVEDSIFRLAQMARAAGMNLVIATQRPSVDVITGVIKSNIPSRIAFAVSSQVDSRTILDMGGAEKLLGQGDMLFNPAGSQKPIRVKGCYVSESEIDAVVKFITSQTEQPQYDEQVIEEIERQTPVGKGEKGSSDSGGGGEDEALIEAAIDCVVDAGMASTSLLQRKLKLGYARAARIIDELEARGIVGPYEGSKPRQVLKGRQ